jgi:SAM-dependent methyltransferase
MIEAPCVVCDSREIADVWRPRRDTYLESIGLPGDASRKVLCLRCGLVYAQPRLESAELDRLYASFRPSEVPDAHHLAAKQQLAQGDFDWLRSRLPIGPGGALEIGSSEGSFLRLLAGAGWRASGVEPSAFAEFGRTTYGLDIRRGLFEAMTFEERSFDLVVALRVLEHVADPRVFLRRIASLITARGFMYLEVPSAWKPRHRLNEFLGAQHLRLFTPASLVALIESEGFDSVAVDDRGRGLRLLARRRPSPADATRPERMRLTPPAPMTRWVLRALYARHRLRYFWKARGRVVAVALARRLPGSGWLRSRRREAR